MYLLWRSWSAFVALLTTVLAVLAILSVLQHNSVLSDLTRQRLSVVAQSVEGSFSTVANLGLPLSMMRNAEDVLDRAKALDPEIEAIHVFNASGIMVHSTDETLPPPLSKENLTRQSLSKSGRWNSETDDYFYSYVSILNLEKQAIGGTVAIYPKQDFNATVTAVTTRVFLATLSLLCLFSVLGLIVFRIRLAEAIKGSGMLKTWFEKKQQNPDAPSFES
ncbi:hypothetical protein [Kiloniella sp.]|uniref:hypothetical protein n=1 Tax=Kiloniella sp. TaxID=1938587 RepID=UPI003B01CB11